MRSRNTREVSRYLTYHEVYSADSRYLYSVSSAQFERQASFVASVNQQSCEETEVRITFDDGHRSQFENALPILGALHLKATFFITAGWTGSRSTYMSWRQLSELVELGHDVQSHGWSHALLTRCSGPELEIELKRSKHELEDHLGRSVDAISMPGGRFNRRVIESCSASGYRRVFLSNPWRLPGEEQGMIVAGRWMVNRQMGPAQLEKMAHGKGMGLRFLYAKHLLKESAKNLLGDRAYHSLWSILSRKRESLGGDELT